MNIKKLFKNVRIILLLVFLLLSVIAINPDPSPSGIVIRNVLNGTAAEEAVPPFEVDTKAAPRSRTKLLAINGRAINTIAEFYDYTESLVPGQNITIRTSQDIHRLTVQPIIKRTLTNETELINITKEVFNNETNLTENITEFIEQPIYDEEIIGTEDLGFSVYEAPGSNVRKGLDLSGGTRVLLKPQKKISEPELEFTIDNIKERLNVFGLSDIVVRKSTDIFGNDFILVEIAGVNNKDIKDLIGTQGVFEAKINNITVFTGGKEDLTNVCYKDPTCEGLDPQTPCGQDESGIWFCQFQFSVTLTTHAAKRQAEATKDLNVITENGQEYLDAQLDLFLDEASVDSLRMSSVFKGTPITDIAISGPGTGSTQQIAVDDALRSMRRLQSIMKTGSLPTKLDIEKADTISPILGEEFERNALLIGVFTILSVGIVVFIRYRLLSVSIPMMITMLSELVIILGFAAFIKWNIDLASIAGIIIAIGTGVDHQIVITDEALRGEMSSGLNWKDKLKRAFFIIFAAYFTTLVAMIPLMFAGAGLLKGFAFTTIVGVSIGVLITRPAFAAMVENITQEK